MTELRLTFRRYYRHHVTMRDVLDEILRHYNPARSEETTIYIPLSVEAVKSFEKRGIVTQDKNDQICAVVAELSLSLTVGQGEADEIVTADVGNPVMAELVKRYSIDREIT